MEVISLYLRPLGFPWPQGTAYTRWPRIMGRGSMPEAGAAVYLGKERQQGLVTTLRTGSLGTCTWMVLIG